MLLSGHSPGFGEEGDVQIDGWGTHRALLLGDSRMWRLDEETEANGRGPGPGPQEQVMVQTGPWPLPRSSPAKAFALCSQCQREVGALENLASVLPNTPDSNW